jgi:hypothetical protein
MGPAFFDQKGTTADGARAADRLSEILDLCTVRSGCRKPAFRGVDIYESDPEPTSRNVLS